MKVTEERYLRERHCFDLAIRMIGHEARTRTIQSCTRLSEDRIRKLYRNFFKYSANARVKRHRGKPPRRSEFFVETLPAHLEAATLASLFVAFGLLDSHDKHAQLDKSLVFGHVFCSAYDRFLDLCPDPKISFDHGWYLLEALVVARELALRPCKDCGNFYPHDILSLKAMRCPGCRLLADGGRRRRLGV